MSIISRVWRLLPIEARRAALYRLSAAIAPKAHPSADVCDGTVGIVGELSRHSGLGIGARLMGGALRESGISAQELDIGTLTDPLTVSQSAKAALSKHAALIVHVNSPQLPIALTRLGRRFVSGRYIVGYWAWELPTVPAIWRAGLNCVHEIWVPSEFTARALRTVTDKAIKVVPHPVAVDMSRPIAQSSAALGRSDFGLPDNAVIVLVCFSLASSFERKNPLAAIRAFKDAFGDRVDRILVMKVTEADRYLDDMARIRSAIGGASNIKIETRDLSGPDLQALTYACDILLSLHRSEGFGLIPAEAMLLGRTIVATNWSATSEYLDEGCGLPVDYRLIPARDARGVFQAPGACWADADHEDAVRKLRLAAGDKELRLRLGAAAAQRARASFGGGKLLDVVSVLTGDGLRP